MLQKSVRSPWSIGAHTATSSGQLPAPENLRLSFTGKAGELLLRFDCVKNAVNYSVRVASSPDGPWVDTHLSTTSKVLIRGLNYGDLCWVRVAANGSRGRSSWAGPISSKVL